MKKYGVLCIISLLLLLSLLPVLGCQVQSMQSEKHYKNGAVSVIVDEYEHAIVELTKAIELDPEYADAYYNRGLAYDKSGEVTKAISDYENCIESSDDLEVVKSAQVLLDKLKQQ